MKKRLWIFCDGSTGALEELRRDAAGAAPASALSCGAGAVALAADGAIVGWDWCPLPPLTNNEAEYAGLLLGIGLAQRLHTDEAIFLLDSEIVVGQMTGRCAVNSRSLHRWHWQACMAARLPACRPLCGHPARVEPPGRRPGRPGGHLVGLAEGGGGAEVRGRWGDGEIERGGR